MRAASQVKSRLPSKLAKANKSREQRDHHQALANGNYPDAARSTGLHMQCRDVHSAKIVRRRLKILSFN